MRRPLLAAVLACLAVASSGAAAQVPFALGAGSQPSPVMSSKDFQAVLDAAGMDDAQRQVASAGFDDAQARMFAAKRSADAARARQGVSEDQRLADAEQARRMLAQALLSEIDGLFRSIGAVATEAQADALEREREAARRRCIRAMLGPAGSDGAAQLDVERAIERARIPADRAAAALRELGPYRQRIAVLLQRLLDEAIAQPRREARARGAAGGTAMRMQQSAAEEPGPDGARAAVVEAMRQWGEAQRQARELCVQLAAAHREGLAALDGPLAGDDLEAVRSAALGRIWPRTAMDPDSPAKVIDQLLQRAGDGEAAVRAVRDAWRPRWWAATMRMSMAEDDLRASGPMFMPQEAQGASFAKARAEFRELREVRRAVDRDAWRALAGVDPGRRAFHEGMAARDTTKDPFPAPATLPDEVAGDAAGAPEATAAVANVVMVGLVGAGGPEGAGEPIVFQADELFTGDGGIQISIGESGEATILGDSFGDGMGSGIAFSGITVEEPGDERRIQVQLPAAIDAKDAARIAKLLGCDPDGPAVAALRADYEAGVAALEDRTSRSLPPMSGGRRRVPDGREREAAALVDAWVEALAGLDDRLIDGIAAIAAAPGQALDAAKDERAALRARDTRYALGIAGGSAPSAMSSASLGEAIRAAGLDPADAAAALEAWSAWAPQARAAAERWRAFGRMHAVEILGLERRQITFLQEAEGQAGERPRDGEAVQLAGMFDAEVQARLGELMEAMSEAAAGVDAAAASGRDAVAAVLGEGGRASFRRSWLRAAAPKAFADARDAMPALDAAFLLPGLSDAQRAQVNALRGEHAAQHDDACGRLAELTIAAQLRRGGSDGFVPAGDADVAGVRFERVELNARSLRRLRSMLAPDQAAAIPALAQTGSGVSRAPTPAAPGPKSP